jgi:DNA-directed RNA polymerase subunit K/omega
LKDRKLSIDNLLTKAKNKFMLSNAVAGRAKLVAEGSLPYVNDFDPTNPIVTALKEIAADKILIKVATGPRKKPMHLLVGEESSENDSAIDRLSKERKKKYK